MITTIEAVLFTMTCKIFCFHFLDGIKWIWHQIYRTTFFIWTQILKRVKSHINLPVLTFKFHKLFSTGCRLDFSVRQHVSVTFIKVLLSPLFGSRYLMNVSFVRKETFYCHYCLLVLVAGTFSPPATGMWVNLQICYPLLTCMPVFLSLFVFI